ncbi:MAG: prolyl oligopeptidase family serine peptidase [Nannocystaceae bacterium]
MRVGVIGGILAAFGCIAFAIGCRGAGESLSPDRDANPETVLDARSETGGRQVFPPPQAARRPESLELHGTTWVDPYRWLRNKGAPEVTRYLREENVYARRMLSLEEALVATLYQEILERTAEITRSTLSHVGDSIVYEQWRRERPFPTYYRQRTDGSGTPQLLLDVEQLAGGHAHPRVVAFELSPDGRYLAYCLDDEGMGEARLAIRDLATESEVGPAGIERVTSIVWGGGGRTIYYAVSDVVTGRPYQVYRRGIGGPRSELMYTETDPAFAVELRRSSSGGYLFLRSEGVDTSEVRFLSASDPKGQFRMIEARRSGHDYRVTHRAASFYILTNGVRRGGAHSRRVVRAAVQSPSASGWIPVLPARGATSARRMEMFASFLVVHERERGEAQIRVLEFATGEDHRIGRPAGSAPLATVPGQDYRASSYRFRRVSPITGPTDFEYDVRRRSMVTLGEPRASDSQGYRSERLFAATSDATKIPITLMFRHDAFADGPAPLLLDTFGAHGVVHALDYSPAYASLLDRGMVVALAHVRGGGERGDAWHEGGSLWNKRNSFSDLIAVAEFLLREHYTSRAQLALSGTGAGGLAVAAAINERPDLVGAALLRRPSVDVVNTMLDASLPGTAGALGEWGNPAEKRDFSNLLDYCPYLNLRDQSYPALLVRGALNDAVTMYWEPAKYVAKLRVHTTGDKRLLLLTDMHAGHGGPSSRLDRWRELAVDHAFLLRELGVVD